MTVQEFINRIMDINPLPNEKIVVKLDDNTLANIARLEWFDGKLRIICWDDIVRKDKG